MKRLWQIACWLAAMLPAAAFDGHANPTYPDRTIKFVVPTSPGGGTDIVARLVAQHLQVLWGQPVTVENKGGAAGNVAAQQVARAQPDGYTLFVPFGGVLTINPLMYKNMGFDPEKDFVPVTMLASAPYLMLVNPKVTEAKSISEFIEFARAQQPQLNYGSTNKGSPDHLVGELFNIMTGLKMSHIPYRGSSDTLVDLLGGRLPVAFTTIPSAIGYVSAGSVRALGVTDLVRSTLLPDVPTIAESGLPGFEIRTWFAVFAPAGTPDAIVGKLYSGIHEVLQYPSVIKRLDELGYARGGMTPSEFRRVVSDEASKYEKIVRTIGIEKN